MSQASPDFSTRPTRVRYGVLGFACVLSMVTYLDRVCFGTVAPLIKDEFKLDEVELGLLFTAFALAYAAFEVPSGWLGDVYGPRRTLIRIVLWWSAFTALTGTIYPAVLGPSVAYGAMLLVRFFFGIGEAGAYPNIARALHNWFPFTERGFAQGAVWMAGRFMGGISPLLVLLLMFEGHTPEGIPITSWRHTFWIFGLLGVVWCVAFWWWFRDRPEQHPAVNPAELALIRPQAAHVAVHEPQAAEQSTAIALPPGVTTGRPLAEAVHAGAPRGDGPVSVLPPPPSVPEESEGNAHAKVPWGRLLTNGNLWTLCLMYFCAAYGWYFNITWLPKYLGEVYGITKESYGIWQMSLLAGAPLLLGSLACLMGGLLTDAFIRRTGNRKWGRRLFGVIGHGACALCYFLSLTASSPWMFVLAIALAAFWNDLTMGSAWASCLDIGRQYSGIVSGCMNTVGNLGGAAAGVATGWVLKHSGWPANFALFGSVYVAAMLLWLRFDATQPVVPETAG
jgi:MFS family permease